MIHLNPKLSDLVGSWLDDLVEDKKEEQREQERKKIMYATLRKVAGDMQVPYMNLQKDGTLLMTNGKVIKKEEVIISKLEDEVGGELVLGEKIIDKLQNAYALITKMNANVSEKTINNWARAVIEDGIISEKDKQGKEDMEKEEQAAYKEQPKEAKK